MKEKKQMIKLGSKVKDVVSGFSGIAIGRCEYITGCTQYGVAPGVGKDGKIQESQWIDETRLVVTAAPSKEIARISNQPMSANGGPQSDAPKGRM